MVTKFGQEKLAAQAPVEIVAVGGSLGGLQALKVVFGWLTTDFLLPVAVVLHRQTSQQDYLVEVLQNHCCLHLSEAMDKEKIMPAKIALAPADYHLLVDSNPSGQKIYTLSKDEPVKYARPSIDVLFESIADVYGPGALGIVLTGGSQDGARGLAAISQQGGKLIVEDPHTAQNAIMPRAAIAATQTDQVYPLDEIGPQLLKCCAVNSAAKGE